MSAKKKIALGAAFIGLAWTGLQAGTRLQFGLSFTPGIPTGEFKDNIGRNAWGGDFFVAYRPARSPFLVGTSVGVLVYGWQSRDEWLSPNIPEVLVDVDTVNSVFLWNVFLRVQPPQGRLRPYLDFFAGIHHLTTNTTVDDYDGWDDDSWSSNNYRDTAFSYGVGGGIMIPLARFVNARSGELLSSLDLDLGLRFSKGGRAEYLTEGSLVRRPGDLVYDVRESETNLVKIVIGLAVTF